MMQAKPWLCASAFLWLQATGPCCYGRDAPVLLMESLHAYVQKEQQPMFQYAFTDLSGDRYPDAVVLMRDPDLCGSGGCTMLVFQGVKSGFRLVSSCTLTFSPVGVLYGKEHGWRTLLVVTGGIGPVVMRFNGRTYPSNPSTQEKATKQQVDAAEILKLESIGG
jgi:hypothetical protein